MVELLRETFLKSSNQQRKSSFRIKFNAFRYSARIEATLKLFCSFLYWRNDILAAKIILQQLLRWKWIFQVNWGEIIENLIKQGKVSA